MTPQEVLTRYWGYPAFRPLQEDIVSHVLEGKDTLALLPTGGGKSICFQVPALAQDGLCLVISPLIALMKDQVENLHKRGITAFALHSGLTRKEVLHTLELAGHSNCKFLYVSPERLETRLFKEYLPSLNISLIAVDEAHCISQWGYDFRPSYLKIANLREELPEVPILALTASATPEVQEDIRTRLLFTNHKTFLQSFSRPNLSFSVFQTDSKPARIIDILKKVPGTGIVYCKSRNRTKEIADLLSLHGISADFYHAGLSAAERSSKQESWIKNDIRIIACTNAFGMGIDKPDVRIVVHADVPDCLENYYQEAGRAGRDGKKSYAVLLYNEEEIEQLLTLPNQRFPPEEVIKKMYRDLMHYLQLPADSGQEQYFEFDLDAFTSRFEWTPRNAYFSLKILEQDGWMELNEQVFIPAKVQFITNKSGLYAFEEEHPTLEPLVKALLRTYAGIFDQLVSIREKQLAFILKTDPEQIIQNLQRIAANGIIEYQPIKDKSQVYFLKNRVNVSDLQINMKRCEERKKIYTARIHSMINYIRDGKTCRSVITGLYFGDTAISPCGICDNCLEAKKQPLSPDEFYSIQQNIKTNLENGPHKLENIQQQLKNVGKEKIQQVITYMQHEEVVQVNEQGEIYLTRK